MNVSPNILAKNFKKLRHDFVDERAMIATTKDLKRAFNINSELI